MMSSIDRAFKALRRSFLHLVFPVHCLHCNELICHDAPLFCCACLTLLELINPTGRCCACFGPRDAIKGKRCNNCLEGYSIFKGIGAAFDYVGPAASLVKKLKYGNQPQLAQGAAAFLVMQWGQLNWPIPDAIVPVPLAFTHWIGRGYNQSALLAEHMGSLLKVPVWDVLRRESGDFSQASLSLVQRRALEGKRFKLTKGHLLADKRLLLLDDVMTSGSTLQRCAEVLAEGCPASLYGLAFCRTP
jgi:ComF family protein